jgi:ABC-type antimicrobial peptide transport system permease subunit
MLAWRPGRPARIEEASRMSRTEQQVGVTTTTVDDREGPVRRTAFRVLAWLLSLWVLLMSVFAAVALGLALVGIYGVLAYTVTQRRREIGIRVALGARPGQVLGAILGQGLSLVLWGLAVGLPTAWLSGRVLDSLLFETRPEDPIVFASVGIGLGAVVLLASLVPARQALRVDPLTALREE